MVLVKRLRQVEQEQITDVKKVQNTLKANCPLHAYHQGMHQFGYLHAGWRLAQDPAVSVGVIKHGIASPGLFFDFANDQTTTAQQQVFCINVGSIDHAP